MLLALKFRGDIATIRDTFAGRTLLALQERAREERGYSIVFGERGREKYRYTGRYQSRGRWLLIGFVVASLVAMGLIIVGLITVLQWVF
jgi:hypothetical protein